MVTNEIKQGIINRLANNSFKIKSWAVGLIPFMLAFKGNLPEVLILIVFMFWGLDAYYLNQERKWRDKYKGFFRAFFSLNLIVLYGLIVFIIFCHNIPEPSTEIIFT